VPVFVVVVVVVNKAPLHHFCEISLSLPVLRLTGLTGFLQGLSAGAGKAWEWGKDQYDDVQNNNQDSTSNFVFFFFYWYNK
jgi:hypothetical protein